MLDVLMKIDCEQGTVYCDVAMLTSMRFIADQRRVFCIILVFMSDAVERRLDILINVMTINVRNANFFPTLDIPSMCV